MSITKLFDISKLKTLATGILASGKKNAPTLMTGGSVILGWVGVYFFWKESRKAEKKIEYEESKLEEQETLSTKDKLIIYGQYCWPSAVMGLASTGLAIGANSINLSRIAEMALLTQFMSEKDEKKQKMIDKLKAEVGDKKFAELSEEVREETFPADEIIKEVSDGKGNGKTLFIDTVMHQKFYANMAEVQEGVYEFNKRLRELYIKAVKRKIGDAFYSSDNPYTDNVYSALDLDVFLQCIGEIGRYDSSELGELMEFRCYDEHEDAFPWTDDGIVKYKEYMTQEDGYPVVCYLEYGDLLKPTEALIERCSG